MSSRIRKILKHTVIAVLSLAVLFLVLNLFLTGRLERYLKRELIERTANATDGFYRLSFDKLSISFFKGELRLEGISLEPDSKVFEHWAALDSLPDTYVSTRIEVIDFKGINLDIDNGILGTEAYTIRLQPKIIIYQQGLRLVRDKIEVIAIQQLPAP